jgi:glutamyl-tRNA reductase
MHLLAIGLNHKTAPLELREQLSFSSATLCAFLDRQHQHQSKANQTDTLLENVIVSTCNRLEYYALVQSPQTAAETIIELLSQAFQVSSPAFRSHLYYLQDEDVVNHLMRVASGLDSMVLGEAQILGQVVEAYQLAQAHHTADTILSRLFEKAIHAGKRARTETGIGLNPASISSIAIRLAQQHLGDLSNQVVMILGTGEMGILAVKALRKQGVKKLLIVNRTKKRADQLAAEWDATVLTFDQLETGLGQADLVVGSTAAPHPVLHQYQVAHVMKTRPEQPLLIVDIALPRDVDPNVNEVPDVYLYNIDDLQNQIADSLKARQQEIPKVETIIAEETTEFMNWYCSLNVVPTITNLRQQFETIRQQELKRALNRLQDLDEREQKIITELSQRLMNKFLHQPTVRLRAEAAQGNGITYLSAIRELFALEGSQSTIEELKNETTDSPTHRKSQ